MRRFVSEAQIAVEEACKGDVEPAVVRLTQLISNDAGAGAIDRVVAEAADEDAALGRVEVATAVGRARDRRTLALSVIANALHVRQQGLEPSWKPPGGFAD